MREYKFRGKVIMPIGELDKLGIKHDNGWVYGNLIITGNEAWIVGSIIEWDDEYIAHEWWCQVDRNTIGQYTGLKDKHGQEIYEGDLVAVADYASWEGLYKVIWDEENSMYMIEDAFGDREKLCEFEEYLVKGNIYENPELLE